jgi:hypothetical protein
MPARGPHARGRESTWCSAVWSAKRLGWRPCLRHGKRSPNSTSDGPGCDGLNRKTPRNTSTYAVPTAPWSPLDRVEKVSPVGRAHALRRSLKKTKASQKKTRQRRCLEEDGVRRIRTFTPAESRQIRPGGHITQHRRRSRDHSQTHAPLPAVCRFVPCPCTHVTSWRRCRWACIVGSRYTARQQPCESCDESFIFLLEAEILHQ